MIIMMILPELVKKDDREYLSMHRNRSKALSLIEEGYGFELSPVNDKIFLLIFFSVILQVSIILKESVSILLYAQLSFTDVMF